MVNNGHKPENGDRSGRSPWERCEYHRNAFALLPDKDDSKPGIAYMLLDSKGGTAQRFCTCSLSGRKTCPHLLELAGLLKEADGRRSSRTPHEQFLKSPWYLLASALFEHGGPGPQSFLIRQAGEEERHCLAVMDESGSPLLTYISRGPDRERLQTRIQPPAAEGVVPNRAGVLEKLALLTLSPNERLLLERGFKSRRLAMEESVWYRLAYHGFREFGAESCSFSPWVEEGTGEFIMTCAHERHGLLMRIFVPREAVSGVLRALSKHLPNQSGFSIHPIPLKSLFRVDATTELDLEIRPMVKLLQEDGEERFLEREDLERFRYGRLVFIPEMGLLAELEDPESERRFGTPRKMTLSRSQVPSYLDSLREEGAGDHLLAPEVERLRIFKAPERVEIFPEAMERDWCWLSVRYGFGNDEISLADILDARKSGRRYIKVEGGWVDCRSPRLTDPTAHLEEHSPAREGTDILRLSKLELLRLQGALGSRPGVMGDDEQRELLERFLELRPSRPLPSLHGLSSTLRRYQRSGVEWLSFLYENGLGGLLCDDMGLGKTHQVMALMVSILESGEDDEPFLVVCPTTVLGHWRSKIRDHAPGLTAAVYYGGDRDLESALDEAHVILTSYGLLRRDIGRLSNQPFALAVFDEIQYLKNPVTRTHRAAKRIQARSKIGLTGTPLENRLQELKALLDITIPGYLGRDQDFLERYVRPVEGRDHPGRRDELSRLIFPFTLRRLKKSVLTELPEKIEDIRTCALTEDQVKLYRDAVSMRGKRLVDTLAEGREPVPYIHVFALLNLLKQICDHPALVEGDGTDPHTYSSGKWDLFKELLAESLESGQKVVVYSQFLGMIRLMESLLREMNIGHVSLTGATRNREEVVARFNQDPECRVYVGSLGAGGLGIDLVAASVVIHYDRWWNAAREDQATDRVHRIGQRRGVHVFKLVTEGTLEEKISAMIHKKRNLMESVVKEDDPGLLKILTRKELIDLLTFQEH